MSNYKIIISELALTSLEENILFIRNFNPIYSTKIRDKLIKEIDNIAIFPNANPIYKKTSSTLYRKRIVNKRYQIVYTAQNNTIQILYIVDGRQAYDKYFKSLK